MSEMNKQELLENLKGLRDSYPNDDGHAGIRQGLLIAIGAVEQLGEPEKVVIPQFVAESFEKAEGGNWFAEQLIRAMYNSSDEVGYWLEVPSNEKLLLRAWLDGYEVEKEKLYVVVLSNSNEKLGTYENVFFNKKDGVAFIDSCRLSINDIKKHSQFALTEKQIKDYDPRFMAFAEEVAE